MPTHYAHDAWLQIVFVNKFHIFSNIGRAARQPRTTTRKSLSAVTAEDKKAERQFPYTSDYWP